MPRPFLGLDAWAAGGLGGALAVAALAYAALVMPRLRPRGIVALELAGSARRARTVLDEWRSHGQLDRAWRNVVLDDGFVVLYSSAFAVVSVIAARAAAAEGILTHAEARTMAAVAPWALWGAGLLDLVENRGLRLLLRGRVSTATAAATALLAAVKFLVLAAGLVVSVSLLVAAALH